MCQQGSAPLAKAATPTRRAPDSSRVTTTQATEPLNQASLPPVPARIATTGASTPKTPAAVAPSAEGLTLPPRPSVSAASAVKAVVPALPEGASAEQKIDHLFRQVLPHVLDEARAQHHKTWEEKAKKAIVAETTLKVVSLMREHEAVRGALRSELRRDANQVDAEALKDGQFRARCCQAIKTILDENGVNKEIRPLFLR